MTTPPGWYPPHDDPATDLYWDGSRWTGQAWYPDANDSDSRMFWDGSKWTGHRRSASEPPFIPKKKPDWAFLGGMALGVIAAAAAASGNGQARRASFARDWDLGDAQFKAQRRHEQYNNYLRLHNQWVQTNWNNPSPPPPPLPPTY
ncbi:DUF2510 domain-containing protein [Mycobacterium sp. 2YAF39]|uniref:DUF2510 domain-containing protein n=1 Tax=Mycobacterium sp. 2YAF39 TaxID=3233033 RepID=UPI003F9819A7